MKCKKSVTEFDKAAGREITTCREFDGPADGELGTFAFAPSGLHWGWGIGAGLAISTAAGQLADVATSKTVDAAGNTSMTDDPTRAKYAALAAALASGVTGGVMAIFRGTRTAGWATIGSGLAAAGVQYLVNKSGKHITSLSGANRDLQGIIAAQQQLRGAGGVQILGLPVASEVRGGAGAPGVQIMGAPGDVEVMGSGFGASFGTNFSRQ